MGGRQRSVSVGFIRPRLRGHETWVAGNNPSVTATTSKTGWKAAVKYCLVRDWTPCRAAGEIAQGSGGELLTGCCGSRVRGSESGPADGSSGSCALHAHLAAVARFVRQLGAASRTIGQHEIVTAERVQRTIFGAGAPPDLSARRQQIVASVTPVSLPLWSGDQPRHSGSVHVHQLPEDCEALAEVVISAPLELLLEHRGAKRTLLLDQRRPA